MTYSSEQCDALLELANIGTGTAATSLSGLLGRPVDITVPRAVIVAAHEVVETVGDPGTPVFAVVLPLLGQFSAIMIVLFDESDAATLSRLLGVAGDPEMEASMLGEIGNITCASYTGAIGQLTGLPIEPSAPQVSRRTLAEVIEVSLLPAMTQGDVLLLLDSQLFVEGESCSMAFVLAPTGPDALLPLLRAVGLAA